jgi:DNA-binding transcriptional regulator YiaG
MSENGQFYKLPQDLLKKYEVRGKTTKFRVLNKSLNESIEPREAFAEINAKYSKSGALLKAVRLREGLNQESFARLIKVTQGDLSKMERGKRPIGKNLATRILKKFGSRIE